jgi:hypothetical protein
MAAAEELCATALLEAVSKVEALFHEVETVPVDTPILLCVIFA